MPLRPELSGPDGADQRLYLHTSPEFAAKKLLAAGEVKIFDFARVFRNRERGRLHAPEFTMLEWYRASEDYAAVIADSLALVAAGGGGGADRPVPPSRGAMRSARGSRPADGGRGLHPFRRDRSSGHLVRVGRGRCGCAARRGRAGAAWTCRTMTTGPTCSAKFSPCGWNRGWDWSGRAFFMNIRSARRRWRGSVRAIHAWRNGLSSMSAVWNWPMALAN